MDVYLDPTAKLDLPKEARLTEFRLTHNRFPDPSELDMLIKKVELGQGTQIGAYATVKEGSILGEDVILDEHSKIGFDCTVGNRSRIMYSANICDRVNIGSDSKVAGFLCDATIIADGVTFLGKTLHKASSPNLEWMEVFEGSPRIESHSYIGMDALIVGEITVPSVCVVLPNSVLTKTPPSGCVVSGTNEITMIEDWKGDNISAIMKDLEKNVNN